MFHLAHRSRISALRPPRKASSLPKLDAAKISVSSKNAERRGTCERRRVSVPAPKLRASAVRAARSSERLYSFRQPLRERRHPRVPACSCAAAQWGSIRKALRLYEGLTLGTSHDERKHTAQDCSGHGDGKQGQPSLHIKQHLTHPGASMSRTLQCQQRPALLGARWSILHSPS